MKKFYPLFLLLTVLMSTAYAQPCTPQGNPAVYGANNVWIGYVYAGKNFDTYKGYVTEGNTSSPNFDESFGGDQVTYNTNGCSILTDQFSARYRLTKTFANAYYTFTVGGDDGFRFSLDGGATWAINNWTDHGYTSATYSVTLNGTYDLVVEYYEAYGGNRISFAINEDCAGTGDPDQYGINNVWRGYLYQGKNFDTYKGFITEGAALNRNFDENFAGSNTNFPTNSCSVVTENFSARFRLKANLTNGIYLITVGGDDGYRLSLDGGATWVINRWNDQSYNIETYSATLNGSYNMVLEYYEAGGDNRVSFSMSSTTTTLPVTLMNWSATAQGSNKVQLNWKTSEAVNFDHFVVQRSTDGTNFQSIQTVAGINGNTTQSYSTTDLYSFNGNLYYRLAMVDIDGTIRYSAIATVNAKSTTTGIKVYPTIVQNGSVFIETGSRISNGTVEVFDMNGRLLLSENYNSGGGRQQVTLRGINTAGTYLLRVRTGNEVLAKQTLILQ